MLLRARGALLACTRPRSRGNRARGGGVRHALLRSIESGSNQSGGAMIGLT
jgi:hypothetical protein